MGYHPHGIISIGALTCFATEGARLLDISTDGSPTPPPGARGFSRLFPGLETRLVTLPVNFTTPLMREYVLSLVRRARLLIFQQLRVAAPPSGCGDCARSYARTC